jgi:hypothetical protein
MITCLLKNSLCVLLASTALMTLTLFIVAEDPPRYPKITATIGDAKVGNYYFDCSSVVNEKKNNFNTCTNAIYNKHPTRILPVKWQSADLESDGIPSSTPIENTYDSLQEFAPNEKEKVEYGPKLQESAKASIYIAKPIIGSRGTKGNREKITSKLSTTTSNGTSHLVVITSEVIDDGRKLQYTISGIEENESVQISAFSKLWGSNGEGLYLEGAKYDIKTETFNFQGKTALFSYKVPPQIISSVNVTDSIKVSHDKYFFKGKVSLYVPAINLP